MRVRVLTALVAAGATCAVLLAARPTAAPAAAVSTGPAFKTIGPLAFGPGNVLFAADTDAAAIVALDLGAGGGAPGARPSDDFDQHLAALLESAGEQIREAVRELWPDVTSPNRT